MLRAQWRSALVRPVHDGLFFRVPQSSLRFHGRGALSDRTNLRRVCPGHDGELFIVEIAWYSRKALARGNICEPVLALVYSMDMLMHRRKIHTSVVIIIIILYRRETALQLGR